MRSHPENSNLQSDWPTSESTRGCDPTEQAAAKTAHMDCCRELERYQAERLLSERRLREVESKYQQLCDAYYQLEEKYGDATKLIVTASRLHYAGSQSNLIQVVFEIAANILGCEEVAI